jgi:hypothetical protein
MITVGVLGLIPLLALPALRRTERDPVPAAASAAAPERVSS